MGLAEVPHPGPFASFLFAASRKGAPHLATQPA